MANYFHAQGRKMLCALYNDNDLGHEVLEGINDELGALRLTLTASAADKPTDTDFSATVAKLYDAKCDVIMMGTVVKDTNLILAATRQLGWKVDIVGVSSSSDNAVAEVPGNANDGYYAVNPFIYAYPDDPRPAVRAFAADYKKR